MDFRAKLMAGAATLLAATALTATAYAQELDVACPAWQGLGDLPRQL